MITYLDYLFEFFDTIFKFEVLAGITLQTILVYNLFLVSIFVVFTRRG